eukprot:scaffold10139_cov74-Cyclotella_meneghiniana.AAC.2
MAATLTSRMSRLVIGKIITPTQRPLASLGRPLFDNNRFTAFTHPSAVATNNNFHEKTTGERTLSSLATQQTISVGNRQTISVGSDFGATTSLSPLMTQKQAEDFAAFTYANRHQKAITNHLLTTPFLFIHHKVKPFIFKRRRVQLRTFIGNEKDIRHSPWRMNLVCQFAAGLTVPEALKQLMFCQKKHAPTVASVIRETANEADTKHGLQPSQLEVAECFATHGKHLKRLKIMGRGRSGKKLRRFSHIRLVLREIDFPTKLVESRTINQKRTWLNRLAIARDDYEKAQVEKQELAELEAKAAELEAKKKKLEEEEKK